MADEAVDLNALLARWRDEAELEDGLRDLPTGVEPHEWVALVDAEQRAGVSRSTLRAWYRGGQIPSRLIPGPHGMQRLVPLDAVMERALASRRPPAGAKAAGSGEPTSPSRSPSPPSSDASDVVRLAELAVNEARERAAAAERRAEAAEQALHEALERAASAEAELRVLKKNEPRR